MKEDPKYQKKFIRPCEVFLTFQYVEGAKRFHKFIEESYKKQIVVDGKKTYVC